MIKGLSSLVLFPVMLAAASPKMRIGYFGHAFFEVVMPSGVRVIMDPFDPHSPYPIGLEFPDGVEADVVIVTHSHPDHRCWWEIGGAPEVFFSTSGSYNGIEVVAHPTKHGVGTEEGENHIMTWETEGLKFAEMGGYGDNYSPEDSAVLSGTDFLFFPAGSFYAMNANLFNPIIENVGPSVAFPEHYETPDHNPQYFAGLLTLEEANEFLDFPIQAFDDAWIAVDIDELSEGPILWEPDYSPLLPGDLAVTGISVDAASVYDIEVEITNNSDIRDAEDAPLVLTVLDGDSVVFADTSLVAVETESNILISFDSLALPESKEYVVWTEVIYPADEAPQNDTMSVILVPLGTSEVELAGVPKMDASWEGDVLKIEYSGPRAQLAIYDASGRQIVHTYIQAQKDGQIRYPLDNLPEGVYFVNLVVSQGTLRRKFILLR